MPSWASRTGAAIGPSPPNTRPETPRWTSRISDPVPPIASPANLPAASISVPFTVASGWNATIAELLHGARMPPRMDGYPHRRLITTRWKDNDVYGHVNNVEYYSFFDTVINEYLIAEGGLDIAAGPVIGLCAESHCAFEGPLTFPRTVEAGLRVGHLGRSSVRYEIALRQRGRRRRSPRPAGSCTSSWSARAAGRWRSRRGCARRSRRWRPARRPPRLERAGGAERAPDGEAGQRRRPPGRGRRSASAPRAPTRGHEQAAGAERADLGGVARGVVGGERAAVPARGTRWAITVRTSAFLTPWPTPPTR